MKYVLLFLTFNLTCHAEYRAYELIIRNIDSGTERLVRSTLDHIQYPGYYPVAKNEVVAYSTSWRCRGNTGSSKKICPNPRDQAAQPKPISEAPRSPSSSAN